MKSLLFPLLVIVLAIAAAGCRKKSSNNTNHSSVVVNITHQVDGAPLLFDTVIYTNAAQNKYEVEKLEYYLSDFKFFKNKVLCYSDNGVFLINAQADSIATITITPTSGLSVGTYDSVAFYIGVDPILDTSNGLPSSLDNIDMAWPDAMGGGYHFLKLEGHYANNGLLAGFAMHIGENGFQVKAGTHCTLNVSASGNSTLNMTMNLNEWFTNPYTYDFNTDGVYSMGDTVLMQKLQANGADVFSSN